MFKKNKKKDKKPPVRKNYKVLFVLKRRNASYGVSFGLVNSASLVADALNQRVRNVDAKVATVVDDNGIDREIWLYRPDVVIIEAIWARPVKIAELARKYPRVKFNVRVHSNAPFLAMEGNAIEWINQYLCECRNHKNVTVSANNLKAVNELQIASESPILFTPNLYFPKGSMGDRHPRRKNTIHIGAFGAIRPLKNQLTQAIAAIKFADREKKALRFYVNATRTEQRGDQVLRNLRALFAYQKEDHKLIEIPWSKHEDFLDVVREMDVVTQVSFTETFSICSADAVVCGVPIVGSKEIDWLSKQSWADTTEVNDIVDKYHTAYYSYNLPRVNYKNLVRFSTESLRQWVKFLSLILS